MNLNRFDEKLEESSTSFVKILVLSQYWYPENGVPPRRWAWLSEILIKSGHEVLALSPPPHNERKIDFATWRREKGFLPATETEIGPVGEQILRTGYVPVGPSLSRRILNQAAIACSMIVTAVTNRSVLRQYRPDLVIGTVPALPTSIITPIVAKVLGCPYVIDLRDAWPELLKESKSWNDGVGKRSLREKIFSRGPLQALTAVTGRAMSASLRSSNGIITTSSYLEDFLRARFSDEANPPRLTTIRNVFPSKVKMHSSKAREVSDRASLNVLYAGTIGRAQKLENALLAAAIASRSGIEVSLKFTGDGVAWHSLKSKAEKLGVKASFSHRVPASELQDLYEWADTALVHLTDWEPLERAIPSKTFELMALGMHISGVLRGESADLITELGAGHVVSPESPEELAELWMKLAKDKSQFLVDHKAANWVEQERNRAGEKLVSFLDEVLKSG